MQKYLSSTWIFLAVIVLGAFALLKWGPPSVLKVVRNPWLALVAGIAFAVWAWEKFGMKKAAPAASA